VFKVPEMPGQKKGKEKSVEKGDSFGDIAEVSRVQCVESKGKQKSEEGSMTNEVAFEKANKNVSNLYHFLARPHS
jgi:hypothetical protein